MFKKTLLSTAILIVANVSHAEIELPSDNLMIPIGIGETTVTHTFEAGNPIVASEVNQNFSDLVSAINNINESINNIYQTLDKGIGEVDIPVRVSTSVAGSSFRFAEMEVGVHARASESFPPVTPDTPPSLSPNHLLNSVFGFSSTIIFNLDGTTGTILSSSNLDLVADTVSYNGLEPTGDDYKEVVSSVDSEVFDFSETDGMQFTYTQNGSSIEIEEGDGGLSLFVSPDGNMLLGSEQSQDGPDEHTGGYASILVGVRVVLDER